MPLLEVPPGFLEAILKDPADPTARLILADFLEDQNDPRGPILRDESNLCGRFHRTKRSNGDNQLQALAFCPPWWIGQTTTIRGGRDSQAVFPWKKPFPRCRRVREYAFLSHFHAKPTPADIFYSQKWLCLPCFCSLRASERAKQAAQQAKLAQEAFDELHQVLVRRADSV